MIIRPVTDLRNHFPDVENEVREAGEVYLTKNGYGAAVLLSIAEYTALKGKQGLPQFAHKSDQKSYRGVLHKYADSAMLTDQREAAKAHVVEKYEKFLAEAGIDG